MIFKEALGSVQRFVHEVPELPEALPARLEGIESWSALEFYLADLETALGAIDTERGTSEPSLVFAFYEKGLSRVRQRARRGDGN